MNKETLTAKLLDLAEGRETPESWRGWWDKHETELEAPAQSGRISETEALPAWFPVGSGTYQPKGSHRHSGKERHSI